MVGGRVLVLPIVVTVVLIAAAPLAQCEPGNVHEVVKDENGSPSTCAETWELTPPEDWTWHGHIVNYGLRWLTIDVLDAETGDILIDREMYRFALYPEGWVDTEEVFMVAGHAYLIVATPNGPLGSCCTVEDVFEGPPVAAFTVSVDGLTASVDASSSYDPDGTIVSYDWDWGDGATGTGMTASHTYVPPTTESSADVPTNLPPMELGWIYGHTYDADGIALPYSTVKVTNLITGGSNTTTTSLGGLYTFPLQELGMPWTQEGDVLLVEAFKDMLYGSVYCDAPGEFSCDQVDVILDEELPGAFSRTITLTVTDNNGLVSTVAQTVYLYSYP
jgi:hypothetical protein